MGRNQRSWWNVFSIEEDFKRRQVYRLLVFSIVYVAVSTAAISLFYSQTIAPIESGELPLYSGTAADVGRAAIAWAALMAGISALFAIVSGLYLSHVVAGPLYRFKVELKRIQDGKPPRPIRLRKGGEFHDVADVLNGALETLAIRARAAGAADSGELEIERVRAAHTELLAALGELDTSVLGEADGRRVEEWRERMRSLAVKLES